MQIGCYCMQWVINHHFPAALGHMQWKAVQETQCRRRANAAVTAWPLTCFPVSCTAGRCPLTSAACTENTWAALGYRGATDPRSHVTTLNHSWHLWQTLVSLALFCSPGCSGFVVGFVQIQGWGFWGFGEGFTAPCSKQSPDLWTLTEIIFNSLM